MSLRRKITWICLLVAAPAIKIFSLYPDAVEKYYSLGVFPAISRSQRWLFGWIPFSVGDLLYALALTASLWWMVRKIKMVVRRKAGRGWVWRGTEKVVFVLLWVYVVFNVAWGLNYNRLGIADQLHLDVRPYSTDELDSLAEVALSELSRLDIPARINRMRLGSMRELTAGADQAYWAFEPPIFRLSGTVSAKPSMKPSMFSFPGLYIGFGGYYNPFTGEAQVNTLDPVFTLPYTTCHEMGHQLGYAKENEANFSGFLAAKSSGDAAYGYSAYMDVYLYALRELYFRDSLLAKTFKGRLPPEVRADFLEQQRFNREHENPLAPVIWKLYGSYLRANRQPHGIVTYSEVTAWLIAYAHKFGWKSLKAWRAVPGAPPAG